MARTKSFKELVQHHVKGEAKFAEALLREGVDAMLSGDVETGKTILRDYIKATVGFEKLGAATGARLVHFVTGLPMVVTAKRHGKFIADYKTQLAKRR